MKIVYSFCSYSRDPFNPTALRNPQVREEFHGEDSGSITQGLVDNIISICVQRYNKVLAVGDGFGYLVSLHLYDTETGLMEHLTDPITKFLPVKQKKSLNEEPQAEKPYKAKFGFIADFETYASSGSWPEPGAWPEAASFISSEVPPVPQTATPTVANNANLPPEF